MIRYMINDFFGSTFDSTFGSTLYSFFFTASSHTLSEQTTPASGQWDCMSRRFM